MSYGNRRYLLHRVLPMRSVHRLERWLMRYYRRTGTDWSKRWLDRIAWFTTPYKGARKDSGMVDAIHHLNEIRHYRLHRWGSANVRWEMYRTDGPERYRALGLTGGSHGR